MFTISKFKGTQPEIDELLAFCEAETGSDLFENDWDYETIIVARINGKLAGYLAFSPHDRFVIDGFLVGSKFLDTDCGVKLLGKAESIARKKKYETADAWLGTSERDVWAGDLLRSSGYKATRLFSVYSNEKDHVKLSKELS
jgi:hypothetical protein